MLFANNLCLLQDVCDKSFHASHLIRVKLPFFFSYRIHENHLILDAHLGENNEVRINQYNFTYFGGKTAKKMSNKSGSTRNSNTALHALPCPRDNGSMMSRPCVQQVDQDGVQTVKSYGITQIVCVLLRRTQRHDKQNFLYCTIESHSLCIYRCFFSFLLC